MNECVEGVCETRDYESIWNKYISEGYILTTTSYLPGNKKFMKYGFYLKTKEKKNDTEKFKSES